MVSSHSVRHIEHAVFNRLIYRCKNQHRHGLYFHHLDHVRRVLRNIDKHEAWNSIRVALGPGLENSSQTERRRGSSQRPLAISTLTRDDLNAVVNELRKLVTTIIPKAAVTITTHLISRGHFLPLAISIVASLARLFTIERRVCSELRAIVVHLNILFSSQKPTDNLPGIDMNSDPNEEDIGQAIGSMKCDEKEGSQKETGTPKLKVEDEVTSLMGCSRDHATDRGNDNSGPSLYSIMAQRGVNKDTITKLDTRTTVSLPENTPLLSAKSTILRKQISKRKHERQSRKIVASSKLMTNIRSNTAISSRPVTKGSEPNMSVVEIDKPELKKQTSGGEESDSEDLDDIFDALE